MTAAMTLHNASFLERPRLRQLAAILLLATLIGAVFGQVGGFEFVFWDDLDYVKRNPMVLGGLTAEGVGRALTTVHAHNWHPLTWISHMVDIELFGLDAGGHHLVNVVWHFAATVLLFRFLCLTTGETLKSLLVAALFAIHPLHVESVAWVSERKDVLAGFFWFATLLAYARYARSGQRRDYLLALGLFVLGLASKPMVVTLPVVLLLADIWPLNRLAWSGDPAAVRQLLFTRLREKLPFAALSVASAIITVIAQQQALISIARISFGDRMLQALHGAATYLWQAAWPLDLIFFYSMRDLGLVQLALAAATLGAMVVAAVACWRRGNKVPAIGIAWYAVTLLPVIGIVQVGNQAHADRYSYLPLVGVFIAACWSLPALPARRAPRIALFAALAVTAATLATLAWQQTRHWKDGPALMAHALAVDPNNNVALVKYGEMKLFAGDLYEAEALGRRALASAAKQQTRTYAHQLLGSVAFMRGDLQRAILHYRTAVEESPSVAVYRYNLGVALLSADDPGSAAAAFTQALSLQPDYVEALINLGVASQRQGDLAGAINAYRQAVALAPDNATGRLYLARRLRQSGDRAGAVEQLRALLARHPQHAEGRVELGELLGERG